MKKQILFIWTTAAIGIAAAVGAPSFARETGHDCSDGRGRGAAAPGIKIQNNINIFHPQPGVSGFTVEHGRSMYYVTPSRRASLYDDFGAAVDTGPAVDIEPVVETPHHTVPAAPPPPRPSMRSDAIRVRDGEKVHIADPFFQPYKGRFGLVTDIGHARNSFNFVIPVIDPAIDPNVWFDGESGKWNASQTFIKQDFSYGITDTIALLASIKYGFNSAEMNWDAPDLLPDESSSSDIDNLGVGIVWRFYDDADYIANVSAFYQWTDSANALALSGKVGRKMGSSIIYGLGRIWGINWNENSYGAFMEDEVIQSAAYYIAYKQDVSMVLNLEVGVGIFSGLDDSWSVGAELIIGDYDWHQQAGISVALNYQPTHSFAVGIYGRMSVWNTVSNRDDIEMFWRDPIGTQSSFAFIGRTELSNYSDMMFGARAMLYF